MIRLPDEIRLQLVNELADMLPDEGCGLLLGEPASRTVERWWPCRNTHPRPGKNFVLDPSDQRAAVEECRARSWAVDHGAPLVILAAVHSHPTAPAVPSTTDTGKPTPAGWDSVIVSFAHEDAAVMRAWQIQEDAVVETLVVRAN